MANTVVSIFDNPDQARQAQEHLLSSGFSTDQVDMKIASYKSDHDLPDTQEQDDDIFEKISSFFKDLFGADDAEVDQYSQAGSKGTILTVHTNSSEDAEKVADILDTFGARDVGETSGSFSPQNVNQPAGHRFADDPAHIPADQEVTDGPAVPNPRVARLKSRIVARSIENNGNNSRFDI